MTRHEFYKLQIGEYVEITQHGQNKGKIGKVVKMRDRGLGYGGRIYVAPYNCDFGFSNKRRQLDGGGAYAFNHESIRRLGELPIISPKSDKLFYVAAMYGEDGIEWSTTNFTEEELKTIDRFLKELNEHASKVTIDCIVIMDEDD